MKYFGPSPPCGVYVDESDECQCVPFLFSVSSRVFVWDGMGGRSLGVFLTCQFMSCAGALMSQVLQWMQLVGSCSSAPIIHLKGMYSEGGMGVYLIMQAVTADGLGLYVLLRVDLEFNSMLLPSIFHILVHASRTESILDPSIFRPLIVLVFLPVLHL